MTTSVFVNLAPYFFTEKEKPLLEYGELSATAFRYESGVCGLRLRNSLGEIVMLPFHGQQIWSAEFGGRNLTMKSMFDQPRDTREYLQNYGGFLVHCGALAMGVPSHEDTHALHGELPHVTYDSAYVVLGEDEQGPYIGLGGAYQHTIAFSCNYRAEPLVKLHAGLSLISIAMTITNLKNTEMEYMYMAHLNFRPVDNGRFVYSAPGTREHVRVRKAPPHLKGSPGYAEFLEELAKNPEKHHVLLPGALYDPEAVFFIDYRADNTGWAHSMQVHPDGNADYVAHRPDQLEKAVRWISRTPDQDCLGIILPATAEPEGYLAEKAKGNLKVLPPKGKFYCEILAGSLTPEVARTMEGKIQSILAR